MVLEQHGSPTSTPAETFWPTRHPPSATVTARFGPSSGVTRRPRRLAEGARVRNRFDAYRTQSSRGIMTFSARRSTNSYIRPQTSERFLLGAALQFCSVVQFPLLPKAGPT